MIKIGFCTETNPIEIKALRLNQRFSYVSKTKTIELPINFKGNIDNLVGFLWIIDSISHECLHLVIHKFIGINANSTLDNLGYNDSTAITLIINLIGKKRLKSD